MSRPGATKRTTTPEEVRSVLQQMEQMGEITTGVLMDRIFDPDNTDYLSKINVYAYEERRINLHTALNEAQEKGWIQISDDEKYGKYRQHVSLTRD